MVSDEGALCTTRDDATEDDGRTRDDDDEREDGQSQCVDIVLKQKYQALLESRNKVRRGRCV